MSGVPAAASPLESLGGDYVSARFAQMVTFRGRTLDSVSIDETAVGIHRLSHTADGLLVQWWPEAHRPVDHQVRLVPWPNVCCCEPSVATLARLIAEHEAARQRPAKARAQAR